MVTEFFIRSSRVAEGRERRITWIIAKGARPYRLATGSEQPSNLSSVALEVGKIKMEETYKDIQFTVVYTYGSGDAHVDFKVYEIIGGEKRDFYYERKGGCGFDDKATTKVEEANTYLHGCVKWDGCSHFYFGDGDNSGYLHLCGDWSIKNHLAIVQRVYLKCGQIMLEGGNPPDPDMFRLTPLPENN